MECHRMFPRRRNAMVYILISASLYHANRVIVTSTCFVVHLSLSSVPRDGISAPCLISLYLSISLWMAVQRGCPCLTVSNILL